MDRALLDDPAAAGAGNRPLTRCFSQGCAPPAEPILPHCWRCQSPHCTGCFHSSSRNLKSFKTLLGRLKDFTVAPQE